MAAHLTSLGPQGGVAFFAKPSVTVTNFSTGTTTITLDTERFDIGGNFASNIFTAPVTGYYQLNLMMRLQASLDTDAQHFYPTIATSNRGYNNIWYAAGFAVDMSWLTLGVSVCADMDASDTAYCSYTQGAGAAQADIEASTTCFSGFLIG